MTTTATAVSRPTAGVRAAAAIASAATASPTAPPRMIGIPASAASTRPGSSAWASDSVE